MQARASWVLAASVLAAVLVLALFLALDQGPPSRGALERGVDSESEREDAVHDGSTPALATTTSSASARATAATASDDPSAPAGELVDLDVIDARTRAAVPAAHVWWWRASDDEARFQEWLRRGELEAHLGEAVELRADARGRVRIAAAERGGFAVATAGELSGSAFFAHDVAGARVVTIAPELDIAVRVVDPRGEPIAGVPVALRERRLDACFDHLLALSAAPDGRAVLRHAARIFGAQPELNASFLVAVPGLFDPPLEQPIDADSARGEPVTLVLEPSGSCEIVAVDASDRALAGPLEARVRIVGAEGAGELLTSRSGESVVLERVALGRELAVELTREAGAGAVAKFRGAGPRRAGERVQLRVPVSAEVAVLRGRVVDSAGRPAAAISARARFESASHRSADEAWSLRTSPDGTFALEVAPFTRDDASTLALVSLDAAGSPVAVARRALPPELRSGTHELGDLPLVELPIVAAGRVVDPAGAVVAGALVEVSCATPPSAEELADRAPLITTSDAEGVFQLRGDSGCDELSISARAPGLAANAQRVRTGDERVELVLHASAAFAGVVLLDPSLHSAVVLVQAELEDAARAGEPAQTAAIGRDGAFVLRELRPGSYVLSVVFAASATELARVPNVRIAAGEPQRDPRFSPLDLREGHRSIVLELADERGDPVGGARAFSRPSDDAGAAWSYSGREGGRIELLSDGRPLDVAISAPGFLRSELERVGESQRVVLRRAAEVRLRLANPALVPEAPLRLAAVLTPSKAVRSTGFADSISADFDARGEIVCQPAFAGALRVELLLARRGSGASSSAYLEDLAPRVIELSGHSGEQVFEIVIDPASLARARESLASGD